MKAISVCLVVISYGLIMGSFFFSLHLARKEHHVDLKEVKNEVPGGFALRAVCSVVYYFCLIDWIIGFRFIEWAYMPDNSIVHISGMTLLALVTALFWWISISLGANYHGPMRLHAAHKLVTSGPYRLIRHPTYLAFPLYHVSLFLITGSYGLLVSGLIMSVYTNHKRIGVEEKLLLERFGIEYEDYKKRAGMYFPVFRKRNDK